ncbi:hypothetical protein KSP39_PZI001390 [Platanthera zijinensis]|uniref:Phospholipase A2 family protein n=1 Tax=Platanthera zijinensis TaxID=2320716 RepID=A0AAP0GFU2_9ASPA
MAARRRFSAVSGSRSSPGIQLSSLRHRDSASVVFAAEMVADKSIWAHPVVDFRFFNRLPSLPRLLTGRNPTPEPSLLQQSPPESKSNSIFEFRTILLNTLQSVLPSISGPPPIPAPKRPPESGCAVPLFRPYVAKVPWHGGVRGFLSQLFPRYGHYCGPNWSSGKAGGSLLWDRRPIDWLDFCCYCHDIGYDDHDQGKLLKADLDFLRCLERPQMATKGGAHVSLLYRSMCIAGLRYVLIPYRMQLLRIQSGPSLEEILSNWTAKVNLHKQNLERRGWWNVR